MLKVPFLALPLVLMSSLSLASFDGQTQRAGESSWDDGWQYSPEQSLESGDFADHVKHLCLSEVLEEDLEAKYINEYLNECAADYGVFDLAAN